MKRQNMQLFNKFKVFALIFFMFQNLSIFGMELNVSELLKSKKIDLKELERDGTKLLLGEFTGAGMPVKVSSIRYIITKTDVWPLEEIQDIKFKHDSRELFLNEVERIQLLKNDVYPTQIKGLLVK